MKLSEWAADNGVQRDTAYRWFHAGILPVAAIQLPTGTILVTGGAGALAKGPAVAQKVALYARVSSSDQKGDLDRQLARLVVFASAKGMSVEKTVTEIGSGLNGRRTKLLHLLSDPTITTIVVEHRERLARFGTEYLEAVLSAQGRRLVVVEERELDDDVVRDMTEILTSFCARLYGKRSAKRRAEKALVAAEEGA